MVNRKLLEVISRLSEMEQKQLRLFLLSPYFTQGYSSARLVELYDYIVLHRADENRPELDKQRVALLFYPEKPFRDREKGPLDVLTSKLFNLVRRFLHQSAEDRHLSEPKELLTLARFYREYGLEERFSQTLQAIRKAMSEQTVRNSAYYWTEFQVNEEISSFKSLFSSYSEPFDMSAVHHSLDTFFTLVKLEMLCTSLYEEHVSQPSEPYHSPFAEAALSLPAGHSLLAFPHATAYRLVYDLLQDSEQPEKFTALEKLLDEHEAQFDPEKYYNLLAFYRYFRIAEYQKKGVPFTEKLFSLYRQHLEAGHLYLDGRIHTTVVRAVILFGLRSGAYDWVRTFLEEHPPARIAGTRFPTEFYNLNYAGYHFTRGEYDEALKKLNFLSFENSTISLQIDVLLVRIYFETQDDLLAPRMRALEQRVRRSGITQDNKERYYNFLKKLDKIIKYGWDKKSPKRKKLIEEIETTELIVEREWLLDKLK